MARWTECNGAAQVAWKHSHEGANKPGRRDVPLVQEIRGARPPRSSGGHVAAARSDQEGGARLLHLLAADPVPIRSAA